MAREFSETACLVAPEGTGKLARPEKTLTIGEARAIRQPGKQGYSNLLQPMEEKPTDDRSKFSDGRTCEL
jgi:hypothetical protein